ncbi:LysR family transcriptional regulator [Vibrio sp. AK197]
MELPPIQELHAFQQVANHLSFSKAAEALSISPSTLSHLIRSLEERLQTRLFNRTTRSVSLTESGQRFFTQVNQVLNHLKGAINNLSAEKDQPQGLVRLSVNEVVAGFVLDKLNADFAAQYPDIELDISVDNHLIDIVSEGFDAGIRLKNTIPQDMIAVPMMTNFRFVTVASKQYVQTYGEPKTPQDLLRHNCLGYKFQSGRRYEWEYKNGNDIQTLRTRGSITTNSPAILLKAVNDNLGIAMIAEPLIRHELESQQLVRLLEPWTIDWPDLYVYFPKNRNMPTALRAVIDALKA